MSQPVTAPIADPSSSAVPAVLPALTPPVATQSVATPSTQTVNLDDPAVIAAIEAARKEEKGKLYGTQTKLKEEIDSLKDQLRAKQTPDEQLKSQLGELQTKLEETNTRLAETIADGERTKQQAAYEKRQLQLQNFLDRRLREEEKLGNKLIVELVSGTSEQEIDESITFAKSEYARIRADIIASETPQPNPQPAVPTAVAAPTGQPAIRTVAAPGPSAFPTAPNAASVPAAAEPGTEEFTAEVKELTSPEAVRSGAWGKHRERVLRGIKSQPSPGLSKDGNFQAPRTYVLPVNHGDVQVPHGHPTGPVANPNVVAPRQPHVTIPSAPSTTTQPPGAMSAEALAAGQRMVEGPPAQNLVTPPASGFDRTTARDAAVASARGALTNPSAAASRAAVTSGRPAGINTSTPFTGEATFAHGEHPMARNS